MSDTPITQDPVVQNPTIFKVEGGRFRTQSLFLEHKYDTEKALFSLKDEDYEFKGKLYPSLKKIYLQMEDVGEYEFATTHLGGWAHWEAIYNNKAFTSLIDTWRYELEVKLRGRAIKAIVQDATAGKPSSMASAKWMADKGWEKKKAGRPSSEDIQRETQMRMDISDEYKADVVRLK